MEDLKMIILKALAICVIAFAIIVFKAPENKNIQ